MTSRAVVQQLGRMIRADLKSGELSADALDVGDMLAEQPDSLLLIVEATSTEARKRRPDERLYQAYAFMFAETLERLRQRGEAGQGRSILIIEQARIMIARQVGDGSLPPSAAMTLVAAFTRSGIDPGDAIRDALEVTIRRQGHADDGSAPPDPTDMLNELADSCDHDPFMIHAEFATMIAAAPCEVQLALLDALVRAETQALREAATGWLLTDSAVAVPLTGSIEVAAKQGLVSATSIAHLMIMRNWMPNDRRPGIDAIIKVVRVHVTAPVRRPAIQVRELLMSERDGAGAQSIFAAVKEGREHMLVSILVKQGHGVRDAWTARSLTKAEADDMLTRITFELPHHETTAEDVAILLRAALADAASGTLPPFGLVQAIRLLGLSDIAPAAITLPDLVTIVLADAEQTSSSPQALARAIRTSGQWLAYDPNVQSWFENGDAVATARKGKRKKADRIAAIIQEVLEPNRTFWAKVAAWSAFARRGGSYNVNWTEMALVAGELAGDRPLVEIPLISYIAMQTDAAALA